MSIFNLSRYTYFLIIIPSLSLIFFPGKILFIQTMCSIPLFLMIFFYRKFVDFSFSGSVVIKLFLISNLIILVRGILDANSYGDITNIIVQIIPITLLFPLLIYCGLSSKIVFNYFFYFIHYIVIISFLLFLYKERASAGYTFSHALAPLLIVGLFLPYLRFKYKFVIFGLMLLTAAYDISLRANIVNFGVVFVLSLSFYVRKVSFTLFFMKVIRYIFLFGPLVFLTLGIMGVFNFFVIGNFFESYVLSDDTGHEQDLLVDSRTSIYMDVFTEIDRRESYLFGLGGSGKTSTSLTDNSYGDFSSIYSEGRSGTESGSLNYIQWGGVLGLFAYFLLFWKASYLALYRSNSWFCKMLGIWVSFKFMFSFIDDRLVFNNNTFLLMLIIGVCYNSHILSLNDSYLSDLFNSIFRSRKYYTNKVSF